MLKGKLIHHQKEQLITLSIDELYDLVWVCNAARYMYKRVALITPAFEAIKSDYSGVFKTMGVKYCVKVHQFYIIIWSKNAPLKFLCSLLNSPTLAEQNLDAMHGNHIKNQKAVSS